MSKTAEEYALDLANLLTVYQKNAGVPMPGSHARIEILRTILGWMGCPQPERAKPEPDYNDKTWSRKGQIPLKATTARDARRECQAYAPCSLYGFDKNDECVMMTTVYPRGHQSYVATAKRNRALPAMTFTRGPVTQWDGRKS